MFSAERKNGWETRRRPMPKNKNEEEMIAREDYQTDEEFEEALDEIRASYYERGEEET